MNEKTKKHKKGTISEEDIPTLFQRYTATTVLALLQEVAQVPGVKIDWNELVKKTATGISNAREYQMLWRHLAYGDTLLEGLDDLAEPLDDDSDLEYEVEAFPAVSSEATAEAAACVKVLVASVAPNDSSLLNGTTVEAPLMINIPNSQSSRVYSENSQVAIQGTNITIPVSVQKQPLPTVTSAEGLEMNGAVNGIFPARRKRKPWSTEEDMELIAAVRKCGEGNWATILKEDFKGERTASQLSQRWAIIRKRQGNLNVGSGLQLSEAQLAARRAVSLALNMPMVDNLTAACNVGSNSNTAASNSARSTASDVPSVGGSVSQVQHQPQRSPLQTTTAREGTSLKSRVTSKKTSTKSTLSPDALVKAAAVAAGARIATPSDAASLLKAAQAKSSVHIMPGGASLIKPSGAGNANPLPSNHLGAHPNVHFIRTGLATTVSSYPAVPSTASRPGATQQVQGHFVKPAATAQPNPNNTTMALNTSSEASNAASSSQMMELEVKIAEPTSGNAPKGQIQEDQGSLSCNPLQKQAQEDQAVVDKAPKRLVQEDEASASGDASKEHVANQASIPAKAPNEQVQRDETAQLESEGFLKNGVDSAEIFEHKSCVENAQADHTRTSNQVPETKIEHDDKRMCLHSELGGVYPCSVKGNCTSQSVNGKEEASSGVITDGRGETMELSEAVAATE